jgi:uncharacterized membrane protein YhaH (DUF805 family)
VDLADKKWGVRAITEIQKKATGRWRRWFFWGWIGATIVIAIIVAVYPPFTSDGPGGAPNIVWLIPPLMILGLGIGLGWLALVVFGRGKDKTTPDT